MKIKHRLLASGAFGRMTANEQRLGRYIRDGEGHPAPAAATPETKDDPFDAAFATHAADGDPTPDGGAPAGDPPPAAAPAGSPADSSGGGAPAGGDPAPAAPAASDPPPAAPAGDPPAAPPAPAAPAPAAAPSADDIVARLAAALEQRPAAPTPEAPAAEPQQPVYTPEETAILEEYEKNWPDVSRAEALRRRAEYHDIFKYVFEQVAAYTQPLFEQVRTIGNTLHTGELKTLVPDYDPQLEEKVASWVDEQPSYLQTAFKQVMKEGTSEEVADLIGRYRAATGSAPAAPAPQGQAPAAPAAPAPAPAKPAATELSSLAIQAAQSLAPVSGERSQVPQGEDKGDFDSAFARHAATMT